MKKISLLLLLTQFVTQSYTQNDSIISASNTPVIFEPGIISTGDIEYNASFSPDEQTVYFSKTTSGWEYIVIYSSTYKNGKWSIPKVLPFCGLYRDTDPFVSADGKQLYFMSDRPLPGQSFTDFNYSFFYVELKNGHVSSNPIPVDIPFNNGSKGYYPSIAENGNIYFHCRNGNDADIFVSKLKNGKYSLPEKLSFNQPSFNDFDAVISKDERFIVFVSSNRKGFGNSDLWISFRENNGNWQQPKNLGKEINSNRGESAPGLSANNKKLYFAANRERFNRTEMSASKEKIKPDQILHSYKNGNSNIYVVDISDIITKYALSVENSN